MMQTVGSFAEVERAMLRERTRSGLIAASKEGRLGGGRPKLSPRQQQEVMALMNSCKRSVHQHFPNRPRLAALGAIN